MGYAVRMSAEIHDWLAGLHERDPTAARLAGASLAALISEGASLGPPLVVPVAAGRTAEGTADRPAGDGTVDRPAEDTLARMQIMYGSVAEAEALAHDIPLQITMLEELRATLAAQRARALGAGQAGEAAEADGQLARADMLMAGLQRLLPGVVRADALAEDLMELRPGDLGAPGSADSGVRILFAVEPPGTALLIAVLEGESAIRHDYTKAVLLSAEVLRDVRAGRAPETAAHGYHDVRDFAAEFSAAGAAAAAAAGVGQAGDTAAGLEVAAAALAGRNRARRLREQRYRLGLTEAQVAERMGVPPERVAAIERADLPGGPDNPTPAGLADVIGYVQALGARLDIIADFGAERVLLR